MLPELTFKVLQVELAMQGVTFAAEGDVEGNTRFVDELAIGVEINKCGLPARNSANIDIYNLHPDDIDQITTTTKVNMNLDRNIVRVLAGEQNGLMSEVFLGEIYWAYESHSSPDTGLHIEAYSGIYPALKTERPTTHQGAISGIDMMKEIAESFSYVFQNPNKVEGLYINDPVLNNGPLDKLMELAEMMNLEVICDDGKIIVNEKDRGYGDVLNISPDTGLIGYPEVNPYGVTFTHEYHPAFLYGGLVNIESDIRKANGTWKITSLRHSLQVNGEGPAWDTFVEAMYV